MTISGTAFTIAAACLSHTPSCGVKMYGCSMFVQNSRPPYPGTCTDPGLSSMGGVNLLGKTKQVLECKFNCCAECGQAGCLAETYHQEHQPKPLREQAGQLSKNGEVNQVMIICRQSAQAEISPSIFYLPSGSISWLYRKELLSFCQQTICCKQCFFDYTYSAAAPAACARPR